MDLKIQSIRFSKDYFDSFEACAKWMDGKSLPIVTQMELDNFYVFEQVSKEKIVDVSLQEYKLDAGVNAMVGLGLEVESESLETIADTESVEIKDEVSQMKDSITEFADNVSALATGLKASVVAKSDTETNDDGDGSEFEFYMPIYKAQEDGEQRIAYGPVLIPMDDDEGDGQGHTYDEQAVEDACHYWMESWQQLGEMHDTPLEDKQFSILECYIAPVEFELNGNTVRKGTWLLMIRVLDDDLWQKIKDGELNGFSIGGVATVQELEE